MEEPIQATSDVAILPAHFPIPGAGFLTINAFVIKSSEPVLVDTGMGIDREAFMKTLEKVIDPADLKWVWITHDDADHTGNLQQVLEAAPGARLVANALAALRMSSAWNVPMDRVYWMNPGGSIRVGDRRLTAVRPPLFDNPTTIGVYDDKSRIYFSADCFGAIIPAPAHSADDIADADLAQGMIGWASADSPWVHMADPYKFGQSLEPIRQMDPTMILSVHLPAAREKTSRFLDLLATVPASAPFVAPDQSALEQILARKTDAP
jgi:glyoxylase-like metal-dependent hydrolase (beta-lactamase superfamily II)